MHEEIPEKGLEMGGPDPKDEENRWQVFLGKTHLHQKEKSERKFKLVAQIKQNEGCRCVGGWVVKNPVQRGGG